jgi:hypothetical protein
VATHNHARDRHSYTMIRVDNVQIRPAHFSDLDKLARLCEALWPKSSAEEHPHPILSRPADFNLRMPFRILVFKGTTVHSR